MAEESIGNDQMPCASMGCSDQTTEDMLREFEERLQSSDSDEEEEFHDAQDELLEEARHQAQHDIKKPSSCTDKNLITDLPGVETRVEPNTVPETIQTDDLSTEQIPTISEASETLPNIGTSDLLPMFDKISTGSSLPSAPETLDNSTIPDHTDLVGATCVENEPPGPVNVDELVQEAVEDGATMEEEPEEPVIVDEEQLLKDLEATWSEEEKEASFRFFFFVCSGADPGVFAGRGPPLGADPEIWFGVGQFADRRLAPMRATAGGMGVLPQENLKSRCRLRDAISGQSLRYKFATK
jgi:hypothetical protein